MMLSKTIVSLVARWVVVASAARLPVAMAPLLLVFALHEKTGNYSVGSLVVGIFVIGELAGALLSGVLGSDRHARLRLSIGLAVSGLAFTGLIAFDRLPIPLIAVLALVAGLASASAPGVLQAMLLEPLDERQVPKVLSIARVQSTIVFLAAPAIVGALSLAVGAAIPLVISAVAMFVGAAAIPLLPAVSLATPTRQARAQGLHAILAVWPIYASGLAATFVVGVADLLIAPLLASRGINLGLAGPLLAAFFIVGLLGSVAYGARKKWPGKLRSQSFATTIVMVASLLVAALSPNIIGIGIGLLVAGSGVAVLLMIRTLALRETLDKSLHAAAFSFNYATSCISYILCAAIGGSLLAATTPQIALLICAGSVLLVALVALPFEFRLDNQSSSEVVAPASALVQE